MKNIILHSIFFLFFIKGNAQTHKVTFANDTCLFKVFNIGYKITDNATTPDSGSYIALSNTKLDVPNGKYLHLDFKYKNPTNETLNPLNGVSTLDMVLASKHILGTQPLLSPIFLIAADINDDGKISVSDLVLCRSMIFGITPHFPGKKSWYIYSINQNIALKDNKFKILINKDELLRFGVVKIGDLNGNQDSSINGFSCF